MVLVFNVTFNNISLISLYKDGMKVLQYIFIAL